MLLRRLQLRLGCCGSVFLPVLVVFLAILPLIDIAPAQLQSAAQSLPKSQAEALATELAPPPRGAERCVFCHPIETNGYARSAMATALRRSAQEPDGVVTANGSTITMHSSSKGFYQSWENRGDQAEYRVDYVIGSGEHASGYLVDIGGHLFQSPVAYYTSRRAYGLAPGYENQPDPDFTRPTTEECVLCHSGVALHVPGTLNEYRSPPFPSEGITCERCHGPVEKHLADSRAGTILNPAKLEPAARDSVCEQCHLFGVARVPNPGKKIGDFLPGQPLENTFTIYRNVMPEGATGDFKVISHVEQLALSACARNSGGKLWCATCHNPHEPLQKSVAYYRAKCLACHTAQFSAAHPAKDSDCLQCHMPRRDAKDGGHTVFTDHRIQRRPAAPVELPSESGITAWREPAGALQKRNLGIAFIDVGMQRHASSFIVKGYRALTEVQQQFRDDPELFKWIGQALLLAKQNSDATLAFDRALQLEPDSATTQAAAAAPYMQQGDYPQAIAHLERAVALDPLFLPAASTLIGLYEKTGDSVHATELSAKIRAAMNQRAIGERDSGGSAAGLSGKKAEEAFKNIQVLKGISSEQLIPSMQFMAASLGVQCSYCHTPGHFEKDDKKEKQTARGMIRMVSEINASDFANKREVTCYSCHRGAAKPAGIPDPEAAALPAVAEAGLPANLPTVQQVLDRCVEGLGGAAAIERTTSRMETGVSDFQGKPITTEVFTQSPNKWAMVRQLPKGSSVSVFDGENGWFAIPSEPVRDMHPGDLDAAKMDSDLHFALHVQQMFPDLQMGYPENLDGRDSYVLLGVRDGQPAAKFYFEEGSGLLVRVIRYADSPLGLNPSQTDYGDYREVDGVQVPFQVTLTSPQGVMAIRFSDIKQNVSIDAARFAKPAPR